MWVRREGDRDRTVRTRATAGMIANVVSINLGVESDESSREMNQ
jgi:hypothetical protein